MNKRFRILNTITLICGLIHSGHTCFQEHEDLKSKGSKPFISLEKTEKEMTILRLKRFFGEKHFLKSDNIQFNEKNYIWHVDNAYHSLLTERLDLHDDILSALNILDDKIHQSLDLKEKIAGFSLVISGERDISVQPFFKEDLL
ncbi:hypothetical protein Cva_01628 [Caedimonas varicaedens]|uniref:Uncharacterized protein n=1 Tax=Caedimonas varicaedens TaxID=1629334 RepID=A0A0K8MFJ0_9PROT|nr:hypothetical protein Cva_01628 [Caedimonas varicaedens]